jgi:regulatory protein
MAGTITALKFQQGNQERVNVYLDGEYAFGLEAVQAARLHKGQVLSEADISALKGQDERNRAFERAVRFLSYRPRSRREIERYLRSKAVVADVVDDVLARLEQAQYLDDEAFARFWVENREQFRPRSQNALRYELRQKGVSEEVITRVLGDLDEEAAAWQAIQGRLRRWAGLPADEFRRKAVDYLRRRGFDYDTISETLRKAVRMSIIEKEDEV